MDSGNGGTNSRADRLGEILGDYFVAVEEGRAPSRQKLLAQHPDFASELAEYFAEQDRLNRMVAPMRAHGETASTAIEDLTASLGCPPHVLLRATDPESDGEPLIQPLSPEMPILADRPTRLQLFGEIGRGGMGAILRGRDVDLGRELAVKVLLESHQDHPQVVRRFIEEAQIGGQLQHPGIVPVYELGAFADRRPYFAMKLVKGQTLAELLASRRFPAEELPRFLSIFEAVCQTMAYAHARGVIHRDLKPSNIMVGAFGEVQVMDWGLAKVLPRGDSADRTPRDCNSTDVMTVRSGSGTDASRAGSIMGTPAYMAPEQARGDLEHVDERADVFGLGAILCEILTGKPPFVGENRDEIRLNAAQGSLADALHRLDTSAGDADLITLARDCLAADRQVRPRDAGIVSARITAYLSGVQELLRKAELARVEAQARAEEERKRRRITVALAASVLVTAAVVGGGWTYLSREHQRRAVQVDLALREAEVLRDDAERTGDDLSRWTAAGNASQAAMRLVNDARNAETRDRVKALFQQVDQAAKTTEADQRLLVKLVDIRSAYEDDPDGSTSDDAYADAFRDAGIDVDDLSPAETGAKIKSRPKSVSLAMVAVLDEWALRRRKARPKPEDSWMRLVDAVRAADPDPRRNLMRELWAQVDHKAQRDTLQKLALEADPKTWPTQSLGLLAGVLADASGLDAAVALLSRTQGSHPDDIWINFNLGQMLQRASPPQTEEAIRFYTVARALRPETAHELADVLQSRGRGDEAVAVFRDLIRIRPDNGRHWTCYGRLLKNRGDIVAAEQALNRAVSDLRKAVQLKPRADLHNNLGFALQAQGKLVEAIDEYHKSLRLKPDDPMLHNNLGYALFEQRNLNEAIAQHQEAIRLKPDYPEAHSNLGADLELQGRIAEAITEYREAIRLKSDYPPAHFNVGNAMLKSGKMAEAIAECREAIRLKPDYYEAHSILGGALERQGQLNEAIAECREAIRLKPDYYEAHGNLGNALRSQGKVSEAIAEYKEAVRLKSDDPRSHINLGLALRHLGNLDEAIVEFRMSRDLVAANTQLRLRVEQELSRTEHQAALAQRLPAVLRGEEQPTNVAERLAFGSLSYNLKRFSSAARLFSDSFQVEPKLAEDMKLQNRYNAACAAALAGCGQGKDEPPLDEAAKARWRKQAIDWLKADLAFWTKQVEAGPQQAHATVVPILQHWKVDPDLAGIREEPALAKLPADEQKACRALWAEVDGLLERVGSNRTR